jgi:hypothetical protein
MEQPSNLGRAPARRCHVSQLIIVRRFPYPGARTACAHFFAFGAISNGGIWRRRRVQIIFGGLTVHVPAKSNTDKTRHQQPGSGYHQPMWIFHLGEHVSSPSPLAAGPKTDSAIELWL